jgi:hypothetical protein
MYLKFSIAGYIYDTLGQKCDEQITSVLGLLR